MSNLDNLFKSDAAFQAQMQAQKPVIAGIDPGTTLGLCVLDCEGKVLKLISEKHRDLGSVILELMGIGSLIAIGTDKKFVPDFITKVATKTGARVISPKEDLRVEEKRNLASNGLGNDHKRDAMASAMFAYATLRPLLKKIDVYCERNWKEGAKNKIISSVVRKNISINDAVAAIEKKEEGIEAEVIKNVQKKVLREEDFYKLMDRLNRLKRENEILRQANSRLRNEVVNAKPKKVIIRKPHDKALEFREKRILQFDSRIKGKEREIHSLENEVEELVSLIGSLKNNYLVKRLSNLGMREFEGKNNALHIQKDDIIFVEDTNIISENVLSYLKDKVIYIIHADKLNRLLKETEFIFIDANKLDMRSGKFFCIVSKESFEKEKGSINVFNKIVEDYKKERGI
ncbi:MAG TPA: DUF460 domain-containing protein [Candidatus Nanoarchaeia archaeon]|nr:DUF460 domain-containing protein [Candidatus Nanoarchaeia archaeon]